MIASLTAAFLLGSAAPAVLKFQGITLDEPISQVIAEMGPVAKREQGALTLYSWNQTHGTILRVAAADSKVRVIDLLAGDRDTRQVDLPFGDSIILNESGHMNAPADPDVFGGRTMPLSKQTDLLLAYFKPNGTALALYFDGPGDGGVRELIFGYRSSLVDYGVPLSEK